MSPDSPHLGTFSRFIGSCAVDLSVLPKGTAYCDNIGVVKHGNIPNKTLSEKQVQADILGHMKYLLQILPAQISSKHVRSHMDKVLKPEDMTYQQLIQVEMDEKATMDLAKVVSADEGYITTSFPFERLIMTCGQQRITSSATDAIYEWMSRQTAKNFKMKGVLSLLRTLI